MAADIWAVADLLRGDYKRHEYGQVILPFTVLRRLDAVMAPTREAVRVRDAALSMQNKEKLLEKTAGLPFFNVSKQDFTTISSDAARLRRTSATTSTVSPATSGRSWPGSTSTTRSPDWPRRSCSTTSWAGSRK